MPRKREPSSKRAATTAKRKPATPKPATRKPKKSTELREAAEQNRTRVEELDGLYRQAAEAELEKTASGKKLLKEARALGDELGGLYKDIGSGKTALEEGYRRARRQRERFNDKHREQLFEVQARLRASGEAVAQILHPEIAHEATWVTESALGKGMVLNSKPPPEDIATVEQGVDAPQPIAICLHPPYPRREDYSFGSPFVSFVEGRSEVDGHLLVEALAISTGTIWGLGLPQFRPRAHGWVATFRFRPASARTR